jgi:hypothetical protein
MTTSNSTDFSTSRNKIIEGALRLLGATAQGESPTTVQYDEAADALNMMVKAFETDGMPLWAMKQYAVPLTASVASYEIGLTKTVNTAKPLRIIQAFFHNGTSSVDIPMIPLTRTQYNQLGNKTTTGYPVQYYYDPQLSSGTLYLFPVPDANASTVGNNVTIVYQRPFEDFDASTDEPDFPQEWFEALKFNLALRLAPEYGLSTEQFSIIKNIAKETKDAALSGGTEEGSLFFQVDKRMW